MKVLLIAENAEECHRVHELLEEFPEVEEVLEADSANDAIDLIDEHEDIDLVISSYDTPEGTGGDVFRHLRRVESSVPFILRSNEDPSTHSVFDGYRIRHLHCEDGYDQFAALFEEIVDGASWSENIA